MCLFLNSHILYLEGRAETGEHPTITYLGRGRRCPKGYFFQFRIDYCTLFSTFDMDKLKKPIERTPLTRKIAKSKSRICWKPTKFRQILHTFVYGGGRAQTCSPPSPPSTYKRLSILATFWSYTFARLRRITFLFGNVTAIEIKITLLLVLQWYVSEAVTEKVSPSSTAVTLLRWLFAQKIIIK